MQDLWQFFLLIGIVFLQGLFLIPMGKQGKVIFTCLCFAELTFLAGFREWNIGNDTQNYVHAFVLSIDYPQLLKSHMESGYLLYNRFLATFTTDPQMLLLTTSIFIIGTWLYTFHKYSVSVWLSVILFTILGFSTTLTMIRQEISTCIILLAVPFIIHRKFLFFLVAVWLASTVHSTAVLAVGLYFLYPLPFKMKYAFWITVASVVVLILLAPILDQIVSIFSRYQGYIGKRLLGEETKLASLVKTAVQGMILLFLLFSYKYILPKAEKIEPPLPLPFLLWCSLTAFSLQLISIRGTLLERLVLYFSAFNFISIPYFVKCYPKRVRLFVAGGLVCGLALYACVIFVYRPEWNHVLPFEFCF